MSCRRMPQLPLSRDSLAGSPCSGALDGLSATTRFFSGTCLAARGLRGMRECRRYIDHEGGARVGL